MMPLNVLARVKNMTRETKLGLAVSCSFLCLLGVVLVLKMTERPEQDQGDGAEVAAAGPNEGPPETKPAPQVVAQQASPPKEPGKLPPNIDSQVKPASGSNPFAAPADNNDSPKTEPAPPRPPAGSALADGSGPGKNGQGGKSGRPAEPTSLPKPSNPSTGLPPLGGDVAATNSAKKGKASESGAAGTLTGMSDIAPPPLPPTPQELPFAKGPPPLWGALAAWGGGANTAITLAKSPPARPVVPPTAPKDKATTSGGSTPPLPPAPGDDPPLPPTPGDTGKKVTEVPLPPAPGKGGEKPVAKGSASSEEVPLPPPPPLPESNNNKPSPPPLPSGGGDKGNTVGIDLPPPPPVTLPKTDTVPPKTDSVPPPLHLPPAGGAGKTATVLTESVPAKPKDVLPSADIKGIDATGDKPDKTTSPKPVEPKTVPHTEPATEPEAIVVGVQPRVSVPPLSVPASRPVPATVRSSQPDVVSYTEESYVAATGDTFASISKAKYGTDAYAPALYLFNRSHPLAGDDLLQSDALQPKMTVYIPPHEILESRYGAAPAVKGGVTVDSTSRRADVTAPAQSYRVAAGGEKVYDIARKLLGDGNRWVEIQKLNPGWNWEAPLPSGVTIQVPADSRLPK